MDERDYKAMNNKQEENFVKPTEWFETKQIESWIGKTDDGENTLDEMGGRAKLIILHQCGVYKDVLIDQLKAMIHNIETDGEDYAS